MSSATAYEHLRRAIVQGDFRPNERLVETELAERYQMSRTPIREVLLRLGTEGLVTRRRQGWTVYEHSADEVRQIYETRGALEACATRLAAERGTDRQLDRISEIELDEKSDKPRTARDHLVELNDEFHLAIADAAGNHRLSEMIRLTREYFFNYGVARLYSDSEATQAVEQHDEIVRRLLRREADAAERAMRDHVAFSLEMTLRNLR